jgi:hypothetical protein
MQNAEWTFVRSSESQCAKAGGVVESKGVVECRDMVLAGERACVPLAR